jgi:hypothetical protein
MGQLADHIAPQMQRGGELLADYYQAALHFIDPILGADSTMDDIIGAAARKQRYLRTHPARDTEEQLSQLTEAVLFVQRVRRSRT